MMKTIKGHVAQSEFDLHGIVKIRLVGASCHDAAAVQRQLGPLPEAFAGDPDITIRFVDRLSADAPMHRLGLDAGAADGAFFVLRSKYKTCTRVRIPFETIGQRCEIVCESGAPAVPLLMPIINLTALANGALPLHASAFVYNGEGVLTTGWSKGGKTEALFSFMASGARYVGDEWCYLSGDGRHATGIPEPITTWDWHLRELPAVRSKLPRTQRCRLWMLRRAVAVLGWAAGARRGRFASRGVSRLLDLVRRQQYVQLPPERAFGARAVARRCAVRKVFFVVSRDAPEIAVEPIDAQEIADRMAFSLAEERADFMSYYRKFRFAFPDRPNALIEQAGEIERERLSTALAGKDAYVVYHPYPVSFPALFNAMVPYTHANDTRRSCEETHEHHDQSAALHSL